MRKEDWSHSTSGKLQCLSWSARASFELTKYTCSLSTQSSQTNNRIRLGPRAMLLVLHLEISAGKRVSWEETNHLAEFQKVARHVRGHCQEDSLEQALGTTRPISRVATTVNNRNISVRNRRVLIRFRIGRCVMMWPYLFLYSIISAPLTTGYACSHLECMISLYLGF